MTSLPDEFHKMYGDSGVVHNLTFWMGTNVVKYPQDMWTYQEIMFAKKPDFVIECGTGWGGSGLFLAQMCELMRKGTVVSIDVVEQKHPNFAMPTHERLIHLRGSSVSPEIVAEVKRIVGNGTVMAILDSEHTKSHVLAELDIYKNIVTVGQYLVVEDSDINGHPVIPGWGAGPYEAVDAFIPKNPNFTIDKYREKFMVTTNPNGFLLKNG